jgi:hypothetical protein
MDAIFGHDVSIEAVLNQLLFPSSQVGGYRLVTSRFSSCYVLYCGTRILRYAVLDLETHQELSLFIQLFANSRKRNYP